VNYLTLLTETLRIKTLFEKVRSFICYLRPLYPVTHNRKALATVLGEGN